MILSEKDLRRRLAKLEEDERLVLYSAAHVQINAPLALEQVALKTEANTLRWVLGLPRVAYPLKESKRGGTDGM